MSRAAPHSPTRPLSARRAACDALLEGLSGGLHIQERIRLLQAAERLSPRDAALALEIALGAARRRRTIGSVLAHVADYDDRRVKPELRAILHCAAQQTIWLDRVPVFAAVDESVELARTSCGARAAGMVNAILRRLAGSIAERRAPWTRLDPSLVRVARNEACAFDRPVLPPAEDAERHLAAATGESPARFRALVAAFGRDAAEQIAWASQATPPIVLQRNTLRCTREELHAIAASIDSAENGDDALYVPAGSNLLALGAFADGRIYVQDSTAHDAVTLVAAAAGQSVLDLCAAPGGKAVALACAMEDRGQVVACDVSPERVALIRSNVERLRLTCVWPLVVPENDPGKLDELSPFDAVLVDVPCSNSGVFARRPEARLTLTPQKVASLCVLQSRLIREAAARTRPGGRLVYSTCSIEAAENDEIVQAFVAAAPEWRLEERRLTLPQWGDTASDWRDGGFAARLARSA